jgi:hypothetical protein
MDVNLKSLFGKLNPTCRQTLEGAAGLCLSKTNYDVELEHWLLKLNELPNTDFQRILHHFEIDQSRLINDLNIALNRLKTGNARTPSLSPRIPELVKGAWVVASIDFESNQIRSSHLLLTLLVDNQLARIIHDSSRHWGLISTESLRKDLLPIVKGSAEDEERSVSTMKAEAGDQASTGPKIFISYRRDDGSGWANLLYDRLCQQFHKANIFIDVAELEPGLEFGEVIHEKVSACDVLIALIGRGWLESTDRLDDPEDFVRLELATALERKIRVIPVLLRGSSMPDKKDLPDVLKSLARRQALHMDETDFDHDVTKLIAAVKRDTKSGKGKVAAQ